MDLRLYLDRAENELELAKMIFLITEDEALQKERFHIEKPLTFYSSVISHSYYCIFYSAKAYLLKDNIKTKPPEEHRKTFEEFRRLVENGIVGAELLRLYESVMLKADCLVEIFRQEKNKRGVFTYQKLAQANKEPAEESLSHAKKFFKNLYALCQCGDAPNEKTGARTTPSPQSSSPLP